MKVGDKIDVVVAGQTVAQAEIKEVGDGTATFIVPATKVVMATKTELSDIAAPVDSSGTQTIVDEVVRMPETATTLDVSGEGNAGEAVGVEQSDGLLSQEKVISSSSVPVPNAPVSQFSPEVIAQIAAAVAAQVSDNVPPAVENNEPAES